MFCRCISLLKYQSGLCFLRSICIVSGDGMSTKVDLHILPCIRDLNRMVDILFQGYLVVTIVIHRNIYILVGCCLTFICLSICRCLVTVIRKLLCDILCIYQ